MNQLLFIYLLIINVIAFIICFVDKQKAIHHKWRIPEATLLLFAWLGGCFGLLIGMFVFHHKTRKWKFRILVPLSMVVWILIAAFFVYAGDYYPAGEVAESDMESDESVTVIKETEGFLFDGPGTDTMIIFYPGAKVQTESYAPILHQAAAAGYDCYLVDMPFHFAFFGINKADDIMESHPEYQSVYISGHSLGGAMAGYYAAAHIDQIDGVIFLASYPTKSLEGTCVLSLYGTEDGVLNMEHYQQSKALMPDEFTEVVIAGGNHAQFGDYGTQKDDGAATISMQAQWEQSVNAIIAFMSKTAGE